MRKGVPDLLIWSEKGAFGIELKMPGNKTTQDQIDWSTAFQNAGHTYMVCYSLDEVVYFCEGVVI